MASITLAEASKLSLDDLVTGVIEAIVDVNPIYYALPFQDIQGNAKTYNRENTLGDSQVAGIDGTILAKAAPSYTKVTSNLTTIIGDAEVNGLLQAQQIGGDITSQNIASKAKSVGRHYQYLMFEGVADGVSTPGSHVFPTSPRFPTDDNNFDGMRVLVEGIGGNQVKKASGPLSFEDLDAILNEVKSKDGHVDALCMNDREITKLRALERGLGGTYLTEVQNTDFGGNMYLYAGVPIYRSEWIPTDIDNNLGTGSATDSVVYALNFDSGAERDGIAGLTSYENMGINVQNVGASETKDNHIWRVKFYSSFAMYSSLAVAMLTEVDGS